MKIPDSEQGTDDAWDDLFRQRLSDYTDQPPADALARILTGAGHSGSRPTWHLVAVSATVLVLMGVSGWLFIRQDTPVVHPVAKINQPTNLTAHGKLVQTNTINESLTRVADSQSGVAELGDKLSAKRPSAGVSTLPPITLPTDQAEVAVREHSQTPRTPLANQNDVLDNALVSKQATNLRNSSRLQGEGADQAKRSLSVLSTTGKIELTRLNVVKPARTLLQQRSQANSTALISLSKPPVMGITDGDINTPVVLSAQREVQLPSVELLASRPLRGSNLTATLPDIAIVNLPLVEPQASRPVRHPSWVVSLTPLYNYQQINPIHTDAEFVSDIRVAHTLAATRLGGRLQIGREWQLTSRLSLRTSLVYQQVRQSLHYAVRSTRPDSVRIVQVSDQSVQVTPFFTKRSCAETGIWHYTGLSADMVWQLNRVNTHNWQHYLTAGATVGRYISRGGSINGFIQAAYGVERPLTTGVRFRVEPTIQLGWQALTDQAKRFNNRPYSYGLALGLRF